MKRWMVILALVAGAAFLFAVAGGTQPVLAQDGHGEESGGEEEGGTAGEESDPLAAQRGAAVYAEFCQACHGPDGQGLGEGAAFAALTYEAATARQAIEEGRTVEDGAIVAMPAYADVLSAEQIVDLLAYLATWESGDVPPLPEPNIHLEDAELEAGAVLYARFCAGCHGVNGQGRDAEGFPPLDLEGDDLAAVIRAGHERAYRLAFGEEQGGPLSDAQIADLEHYLRSLDEQETADEESQRGYSLLIIVGGVLAILIVGSLYWLRMRYVEE